jgi:hypothetical protein
MFYRTAIASIAILCFTSIHGNKNLSRPDFQITGSSRITECSIPKSLKSSLDICENQCQIEVDIPMLHPIVVEEEILPIEVPCSTASVQIAPSKVALTPVHVERTSCDLPFDHSQHPDPTQCRGQLPNVSHYITNPAVHPAMQVQNYNLFQYRRMMINHPSVSPHELQGSWRGVNKGLATVAIDEQFIKHFQSVDGQVYGDNILVHQVPLNQVHQNGWQPKFDPSTRALKRHGKFKVMEARGRGAFRHGLVLSYRHGGNSRRDPARLIEDRLVKLDDNHLLGRATVRLGPIRIPLAYFVLERVQ